MKRNYKNPPIIEAICELTFKSSQKWDWTIPGLFYKEVKSKFPKKREKKSLEFQLHTGQEEIEQKFKGGIALMQFLNNDETALLQVGPDKLAANMLKPYLNWESFRQMIHDAFYIYKQIAEPEDVTRIGLRYINRIDTNHERVETDDYLTAVPQVPDQIPQVFSRWVQRVEIPFEDVGGLLILHTGSIHENEKMNVSFLLDLDFVSLDQKFVDLNSALEWIETAHAMIERSFEACITDKTRNLFQEVVQDG